MALTRISTAMISQAAASVDLNIDAGTLYIDSTNNRVGIANTNPSTPLHVTGTATVTDLSSGNITTTGYLRGPSTFTIDPATHGDNTGTVVIAGNLQVDGTTTTINSTTLTVDDKLVTLASGSANASAANGAGIEVEISGTTNPSLTYDGTNDEWDFNKDINVTGRVVSESLTVSRVGDGSTAFINIDTDATDHGMLRFREAGTDIWRIVKEPTDELVIDTFGEFRARFDTNGDFSLFENTGSDVKFFWDASAESLGIGTGSNIDATLHIQENGEPGGNGSLILEANSASRQLRLSPPSDAANGYINYKGGNLLFQDDGVEVFRFQGASSVVVNDPGNDVDFRVESNNFANMLFVDAGNDVVNVGGTTVETGDTFSIHGSNNNTTVRIYNTAGGGDGSLLIFQKDSSSPADQDALGDIRFHGNDDGGTMTQFARIKVMSADVTHGTEDGQMIHYVVHNGSTREVLRIGSETVFNQDGQDIDFRVEGIGNANALFVQGSNGNVGIGTASPNSQLSLSEETSNTTTRSDQLRVEAKSSGTTGVGFGANIYFVGERSSGHLQAMGRIGYAASTNTSSNLSSDFVVETASAGTPDEHFRVTGGGHVGIGTDNPASGLHITGTDNTKSKLTLTNTAPSPDNTWSLHPIYNGQDLYFQEDGTTRVTFQAGGNVGIGDTSPGELLSLYKSTGTTLVQTAVAGNSTVGLEIKKTGSTTQTWRIADGQTVNGALEFYDLTNDTSRMIIRSGNVGINDSNPDRKVSIIGDSTSGGQYPLSLDATNTDYTLEFRRNGNSEWWIKQAGSSFNIHENGVGDNFRIFAGGNISIGSHSASYKLDVGHTNSGAIQARFKSSGDTGYTQGAIVLESSDSTNSPGSRGQGVYMFNHGTDRTWYAGTMYSAPNNYGIGTVSGTSLQVSAADDGISGLALIINSDGKVGIGHNTPNGKLDIDATGIDAAGDPDDTHDYAIVIRNSSTTNQGNGIAFTNDDAQHVGGAIIHIDKGSNNLGDLAFYTAATSSNPEERLRITSAGTVGIGTASPASLLEVRKTTAGNITSTNGREGAVLTLHHEAQWENGYTGGDFLGGINFSTGDASSGEGVRAAIKTSVDTYYNTNKLRFYVAPSNNTTLSERMQINHNGDVGINTTNPLAKVHIYDAGADNPTLRLQRGKDGGRIQFQYASNTNGYGEIGQTYYGAGQTRIWIGANLESFSTGHNGPTLGNSSAAAWYSTWNSGDDEFTVSRLSGSTHTDMLTVHATGQVSIATTSAATNSKLNVDGGIRFNQLSAGHGLNTVSYQSFNNSNTANSVGSVYYSMFVLNIYHNNGHSQCFFVANGGGGVGYNFTGIVPGNTSLVTGTGISTSFTTIGSSPNTFTVAISSGGGALTINRTSGTGSFGVSLQKLAGG